MSRSRLAGPPGGPSADRGAVGWLRTVVRSQAFTSGRVSTRALAEIVEPTLAALDEAGTPYNGVLYAGLMLTADGPKLIEYNARFGDPECQVLMLRFTGDLSLAKK